MVHKRNPFRKEREYDIEGKNPRLGFILRCDVEGTLEALLNVFESYKEPQQEQVKLDFVDFGIGPPNEKTLELAEEFKGLFF